MTGVAHLRIDTGDEALPVLVRDHRFRVIHEGLGDGSLRVPPGRYVVSVHLPGDRLIEKVVDAGGTGTTYVRLTGDDPEPPPLSRAVPATSEALRLVSAGRGAWPAGWQVRLLAADPLLTPLAAVPRAGRVSTAGHLEQIELETSTPDECFLEVVADGTRLVLAVPGRGECLLVRDTRAGGLALTAYPRERRSQLAAQFLMFGDVQRGRQLLAGRARRTDAIEAALWAYLGAPAGDRRTSGSPDLMIVQGERDALSGAHASAVTQFIEAGRIGLPIFTTGFSLLISRLRQYVGDDGFAAVFTAEQAGEIRRLFSLLGQFARYVDLAAPTTTFRYRA